MKSKRFVKLLVVPVFLVICLLVSGCDKKVANTQSESESEPVKKEEIIPPKKVKIIDMESKSRPYAVMINNNGAVWKYQSGLNDAYIVYEMLVEGGITREMALFKDKDVEKIQSIRSSRHYYLDYVLENDAIYVHWGWSPQAQSDISKLHINNINGLTYENRYFYRDKTVRAGYEHKGYTKMSLLKNATANLKYRSETENKSLLDYSIDPLNLSEVEGAKIANYVGVRFSSYQTSKFIYDSENKVYIKKQNNTDMIDYTSKEPFKTKNIIAYTAGYSLIPNGGKGRLNMDNTGTGSGYYISEGYAIPITWQKNSRGEKTIYKMQDGTPLKVNDGNTYIEIYPNNSTLSISEEVPA